MKRGWAVAVVAGAGLLAGCPGDDSEPTEAFCTGFGNGATYQWTACNAGCTLANPALAYDLSLQTTATIVPVDGQTTYTAVLTATAAADIPGGADVGVFVTQPTFANFQNMTSTLRTIRNGVQVETLNNNNDIASPSENGTPAAGFVGMHTTQAFDQVEFTAILTWSNGQVPNYSVYEICADGGNQ